MENNMRKRLEALTKRSEKTKRLMLSEGLYLLSEPVICKTPERYGSESYVHHMRLTLQLYFGNAVRYRRLISSRIESDIDYRDILSEISEEMRALFYEVYEYKAEMLEGEYCAHEVEEV